MLCAVCNKESNNRRVCPYCFTPYPGESGGGRQSGAMPRASTSMGRATGASPKPAEPATAGLAAALEPVRAFIMRQTPVVRWSGLGILVVLVLWMLTSPAERSFEAGAVPSNIIATPMQRDEAVALIRHTRETALVEAHDDEVNVSYPAATFPVQEEGQIALAQQFARADEIVEGRKRRIFFFNPNGRLFAQSDGVTGVTVVR